MPSVVIMSVIILGVGELNFVFVCRIKVGFVLSVCVLIFRMFTAVMLSVSSN